MRVIGSLGSEGLHEVEKADTARGPSSFGLCWLEALL
jgi:hypothetical protein